MFPEDIIIEPVQTEKAVINREKSIYTFYVHSQATKGQIKEAIKKLFLVDARKINIIKKPAKVRRLRGRAGYTRERRKAVIKLKEGQTIKLFEGA
ncbi:MAG: 50S ribosomal protein L23 [Candidatus Hydrogenedentota bacterium]